MEFTTYLSDRNIPLVFIETVSGCAGVITVENYLKWYSLYLVREDESVEKVPYDNSFDGGHVFNPSDVELYAQRHGYEVDGNSMQMIVGRWVLASERMDAENIGELCGYAPENAAKRDRDDRHFCSASCPDFDLTGRSHYPKTEEFANRANDLSDDYHENHRPRIRREKVPA